MWINKFPAIVPLYFFVNLLSHCPNFWCGPSVVASCLRMQLFAQSVRLEPASFLIQQREKSCPRPASKQAPVCVNQLFWHGFINATSFPFFLFHPSFLPTTPRPEVNIICRTFDMICHGRENLNKSQVEGKPWKLVSLFCWGRSRLFLKGR